jgi:hypothetical protein
MNYINHNLKDGPRPIPTAVLTGFLGVGKTTLLTRILNGDHSLRVVVPVNDFGSPRGGDVYERNGDEMQEQCIWGASDAGGDRILRTIH